MSCGKVLKFLHCATLLKNYVHIVFTNLKYPELKFRKLISKLKLRLKTWNISDLNKCYKLATLKNFIFLFQMKKKRRILTQKINQNRHLQHPLGCIKPSQPIPSTRVIYPIHMTHNTEIQPLQVCRVAHLLHFMILPIFKIIKIDFWPILRTQYFSFGEFRTV